VRLHLHAGQAAGTTGIPPSRFAALPGQSRYSRSYFRGLPSHLVCTPPRLLGLLSQGSRDLPRASRFARHPRALPLPGVAHWPLAVPMPALPWPRQVCLANDVLDRGRDSRRATLGTLARGARADSLRRRRSAAERRPERQAETIAGICNVDASCAQRHDHRPTPRRPPVPTPRTRTRRRPRALVVDQGRWVISDEQPRVISGERRR